MKSLFLNAVVLTMLSINWASAQGTFLFRNYHPTGLDAPVFDAVGNRLSGTHYMAVLYGGATTDSMSIAQAGAGAMPPESLTAVYNGQPGYFSAFGDVVIPSAQFAWLQVRVWDSRLGETYDEVASLGLGGYGASPLFQALGGDILATGRPPQPLIGLQSFSLVPEPGTWALLAVGVGTLFWKCRRRR